MTSKSPGDEWEEILGLGEEKLWVLRENKGVYPIGSLQLTEYEFCLGHNIYGKTPERERFKFMEDPNNQQVCEQIDDTISVIDSLGEEDFFASNNISNNIPGFPRFTNEYYWKLGGKEMVHWNEQCRANADFNMKTLEKRLNLDEIQDLNTGFITCIIISISIAFLIISIDLIKRYSNRKITGYKNTKRHYEQKQLKSAFLILDIFAKLICIPVISIQIAVSLTNRKWYTDIVEMNCSTGYFY